MAIAMFCVNIRLTNAGRLMYDSTMTMKKVPTVKKTYRFPAPFIEVMQEIAVDKMLTERQAIVEGGRFYVRTFYPHLYPKLVSSEAEAVNEN